MRAHGAILRASARLGRMHRLLFVPLLAAQSPEAGALHGQFDIVVAA